MPWAEQLPNGKWRACWRDAAGRKRSKSGHRNKATALRVAGEYEAKNRRGELTTDGRCPTWGEWCPIWLEARTVEPSTAAGDAYRIKTYLMPRWRDRRLNRITATDVQAWVNELGRGDIAPGTVEKIERLFSASLTEAVKHEQIPLLLNPCAGVKLPRSAPGHERFLTRPEVEKIAHFLNEPYRLAVVLAAWTGMRWGELAGLHWQRVDLGTGMIDVIETWDPTAGRIKPYTKGHARRAVPIAPRLGAALAEAYDRATHVRTCGQVHAPGGVRCRSGLVLIGDMGAPLNGRNFGRRQFTDAYTASGIDPLRLHDLRHTYASWLVQDGVPLQEVQKLLGHASITTTERYAHLGTSQHARVLAALS